MKSRLESPIPSGTPSGIQELPSPEEDNRLFMETLKMHLSHLNAKYGIFLTEMLFEIYDEYCEDGNMEELENYLGPKGVPIEIPNHPGETYTLKLKPYPLQFVLENGEKSESVKVA